MVATTNRPDILDPALLRRFDETIHFPAPSVVQMQSLAGKLTDRYAIDPVDIRDCQNFDAVTKTVEREARRRVMAEILAADAQQEDEEHGEEES
jgi:SpoVK/Ycf46/Vps4 family AAA+-type ATPase